ncbi:MAG: hypothetical protein FJ087_18245, partial [Deltaproteobacteria bacterium]|nr:hypothetical protein [Deltaproteobacteria bacterium]
LVRDRLAPAALRLVRDRLAPPALRVVRDRQAPPALRVVRSEAWRARVATAAGLAVWLVLVPLAVRAVDLVPRGRAVGGSMWFTERTRPDPISRYDSGRTELRFADRVRRWTDRDTGVLVHDSIGRTVPECRFDTTLDREMRWVRGTRPADLAGPPAVGVTGWVFIAPVGSLPPTIRAELASRHPWRQLGDHVMVDLRSDRPEIEVWRLDEQPFDLWWWFWRSAFEPEVLPVRDPAAEEALSRAVERARTGR